MNGRVRTMAAAAMLALLMSGCVVATVSIDGDLDCVFVDGSGAVDEFAVPTDDGATVEREGRDGLRVRLVVGRGDVSVAVSENGRVTTWLSDVDLDDLDESPLEMEGTAPSTRRPFRVECHR